MMKTFGYLIISIISIIAGGLYFLFRPQDDSIREIQFEAIFSMMEIKARGVRSGADLLLTLDTGGEQVEHTVHFQLDPGGRYRMRGIIDRIARTAPATRSCNAIKSAHSPPFRNRRTSSSLKLVTSGRNSAR